MGEATNLNEEQYQKPTDRLGRCADLAREHEAEETRGGYRMWSIENYNVLHMPQSNHIKH